MSSKHTIYGKAQYCYLSQPDTGFGKEEYHVTLELPKDKAQEHIKVIEGIISKEIAEEHKARPSTKQLKRAPLPYKVDGDLVTFKVHSKYKPKLWSKKRQELGPDVYVWKDSTMWVNYEPRGYNKSIGIGCTLYMGGHGQKDNLVEGTGEGTGTFPYPDRDPMTQESKDPKGVTA